MNQLQQLAERLGKTSKEVANMTFGELLAVLHDLQRQVDEENAAAAVAEAAQTVIRNP